MRIPLSTPLLSRDGTLNKDPHLRNCLVEVKDKSSVVMKRPGLLEAYDMLSGAAQGTVCWNGTLYAVRANEIVQGPTELPVADGSLWSSASLDIGALGGDNAGGWYEGSTAVLGTSVFIFLPMSMGGTSTPRMYQSSDGVTFTSVTLSGLPTITETVWRMFSHKNWLYIAYTGSGGTTPAALYRSSDGATWTLLTTVLAWSTVQNTTAVFCSDGTYIYCANPGQDYKCYRSSTDGASWVEMGTGFTWMYSTNFDACMCVFGSKLWWFDYTTVRSSSNGGATWAEEVATPSWVAVGNPRWAIRYNTRTFIGVNSNSGVTSSVAIYSSLDGVTWDQENSGVAFTSAWTYAYYSRCFGLVPFAGTMLLSGMRSIDSTHQAVQTFLADTTGAGGQTYTFSPAGLPLSMIGTSLNAAVEYLFLKTTAAAWILTFGEPGTITQVTDADYPTTTVPGVVFLDGYIFVMDAAGTIYNSDVEAPLVWNSLNYVTAESESDVGRALGKHQGYVVAFKDQTIEFFYDAANATGSPLARMPTSMARLGCASGYSLATCDGVMYFVSKTVSSERSVHVLPPDSLVPVEIADENIRRILTRCDFTDVKAWAARLGGHPCYVLGLKNSNITLVFDAASQLWSVWTYLTPMAPITLSSLTQVDGVATATYTAHGLTDGSPVTIAGATSSGYNGAVTITVMDADHFTYEVASSLASPATGAITVIGSTEGYFPFPYFTSCQGSDLVQHESSGKLYEIGLNHTDDNGQPIDVRMRLAKIDNRSLVKKVHSVLQVVGDQVAGTLLVRYTDDDYQTLSTFRAVSLATDHPVLRRLGDTRRRAYELRYTGDTTLRLAAIEIE